MVLGACDIIPSFILRQDLTFSENIVFNYLIITQDKAKAIGMSMNFIARSAAQRALTNLTTKYRMVSLDEFGKVKSIRQCVPNMIPFNLSNKTGRPSKSSEEEVQERLSTEENRESSGNIMEVVL